MRANQIMELCERHVRHQQVDFAAQYGEPGYDEAKAGILFADWNDAPSWLRDGLERRGYQLEWSDEWIIAHETGKAYRTSPDCWQWTPYYVLTEDCDVIGGDEIESGDQAEWYVDEYLLNNPEHCNVFRGLDLTKHGFKQAFADLESGWHPGQNDKPADLLKRAQADYPNHDVVFQLDDKGQFDCRWSVWVRPVKDASGG